MKNLNYNINDPNSIEEYGKRLENSTLNNFLSKINLSLKKKNKGLFGQVLEEYFGITPTSSKKADFHACGGARVELKSTPLKKITKGLVAKERLVFNIINYMTVHNENWKNSSFLDKNKLILLIVYLFEKEKSPLDYKIIISKLFDMLALPSVDLEIIKNDWNIIVNKIKNGKAHEISEGDTLYLAACTKGSTAASSYREQPFSKTKAKQRAFSFKTKYINYIIGETLAERNTEAILSDNSKLKQGKTLEEIITDRFNPYVGKTIEEIHKSLNIDTNIKAKSYFANIAKSILGIKDIKKEIEEFSKADICMKTIRLNKKGIPEQHMSFPSFKYLELIKENWNNASFKEALERRFFMVIYKYDENNELRLFKVFFWTMPIKILEKEVKKVWKRTVRQIKVNKYNELPKTSESDVCHVRPHARIAADTYPTLDGVGATKKCFWLNKDFLKSEIENSI